MPLAFDICSDCRILLGGNVRFPLSRNVLRTLRNFDNEEFETEVHLLPTCTGWVESFSPPVSFFFFLNKTSKLINFINFKVNLSSNYLFQIKKKENYEFSILVGSLVHPVYKFCSK